MTTPLARRREGRETFYPDPNPLDLCPYTGDNYKQDWLDGWKESEREHKLNLEKGKGGGDNMIFLGVMITDEQMALLNAIKTLKRGKSEYIRGLLDDRLVGDLQLLRANRKRIQESLEEE